MRFSCAGKVFITGEYACLEGGPALLGTVGPLFELTVEKTTTAHFAPFAAQSPAGLYLAANADALEGVKLTWLDPYDTPIGVGSSSAQFNLSVAAMHWLRKQPQPGAEEVLKMYWRIVGESQGLRPSGADIVSQWLGGPVVVRNSPFTAEKLEPWAGTAQFILAYTGTKAKTHEHLLGLRARGFPREFRDIFKQLDEITLNVIAAWRARDAAQLGRGLNIFQHTLTHGGLAPLEFTSKLESIQQWPGVLGCKGSGAQGGDCVLLLVEPSATADIFAKLVEYGWSPKLAKWRAEGLSL